jgi:ribosomal-protein-serine acetyltransferase
MFAISLGDDGAELRPLEPWRAEEFLGHIDRGREFIGQHTALPSRVPDLESSRAFLRSYAEKATADAGRIYGIWTDGTLVGGVSSGRWTSSGAPPRRAAGWSRRRWAGAW